MRPAAERAMSVQPVPLTPEHVTLLRRTAFVLETVGHLTRQEALMLPAAAICRALADTAILPEPRL